TRLLYQHTDPHNSADLWTIEAKPNAPAVRLTDSMPASIDRAAFVEPEMIHYAGPDGQQVPAWLLVPKNLDRSRKHPAVVWIHGDGVNQNYDGWHVQRNYAVYYSFHQYLLQKGYVVIAPDYRGSIGYGRAWRQGVYMDGGELSQVAAVRRRRSARRLGVELRRLLHADRRDRSADALPRGGQCGRRRRLRDVLRGSVPRRLDREPHRHAAAEPEGVRAGVAAVARRSPAASAARAARHLRRQRPVPALGA